MLPTASGYCPESHSQANAEFLSELGIRRAASSITASKLTDHRPGQLGARIQFTLLPEELREFSFDRYPTLRLSIAEIIEGRAEEHMGKPDAQAVVALVTDKETSSDRTVGQYPCDAMSVMGPSVELELSVAAWESCGRPKPASLGLVDLAPEAFGDGLVSVLVGHDSLTIIAEDKVLG